MNINHRMLVYHCKAAYMAEIKDINYLLSSKCTLIDNNYHQIQKDNHAAFLNKLGTDLIIAYRGTDEIKDVCLDLKIKREHFDSDKVELGLVHEGFLKAHRTLWPLITEYIDSEKDIKSLYLTGHSLGGSIATIASLEASNQYPQFDVEVVTFGCPRVGDKIFTKVIDDKVKKVHRYVNFLDPITQLPFFFRYRHCGHSTRLFKGISNWNIISSWIPWLFESANIASRLGYLFFKVFPNAHNLDEYINRMEKTNDK